MLKKPLDIQLSFCYSNGHGANHEAKDPEGDP